MSLRLATAWALLALAAWHPGAQAQISRSELPSNLALERVGLERHWHNRVPLGLGSERLLTITPAASTQVTIGTVGAEGVSADGFAGDPGLSPIQDVYRGWRVKFLDGPLQGQTRSIASYSGPGRRFQLNRALPAAPAAGAKFELLDLVVFAQTNAGNFHAFDGETGQHLWGTSLGPPQTRTFPASVNSRAVFVTNGDDLIALDRGSGRQLWRKDMPFYPSAPTACDEDLVMVGMANGRLEAWHLIRARVGFKSSLKTYAVPGMAGASGEALDQLRELSYLREPLVAWNYQTDGRMTSRPLLARPVVAFASGSGKVYVGLHDEKKLLFRYVTEGPVVAPLANYGARTLLVSSLDRNVYAIDVFTGEQTWSYASGAPVEQEPLVAGNDIFIENSAGRLASVDPETGEARWVSSAEGGILVAVGETKLYLKTRDGDLFVVDRKTGRVLDDARSTSLTKGLNLRSFTLVPTNQINDRLFMATPAGSIVALREQGKVNPTRLRVPTETPFGYIPPEGYPDENAPGAAQPGDLPPAEEDVPPPM